MRHTTFYPGRISALSDGVFAIAMTLLVLNLQLPELGSQVDPSAFAVGLVDQLPRVVRKTINQGSRHPTIRGAGVIGAKMTSTQRAMIGHAFNLPHVLPIDGMLRFYDQAAKLRKLALEEF